jgi:Trypsin-like peptidase domain
MAKQNVEKLLQECTVRLSSPSGSGTGFFVSPGGLILTCNHVIDGSNDVNVVGLIGSNKQEFTAKAKVILQVSKPVDIALLQIEGEAPNHKCVYFDNTLPQTGDKLYTFGYSQQSYKDGYLGGDSTTIEYEEGGFKPNIFEREGENFKQNVFVFILKLKQGEIQRGQSGSALLNLRTGKVCGIVSISRNADLGGRATPSSILFNPKDFVQSQDDQNRILRLLEDNDKYHHKTDKTWIKIIRQSFWDRIGALVVAGISLICFCALWIFRPENLLISAILRFLVSCGFGYSAILFVISLNLKFAKISQVLITSLTGFITTILAFGISFWLIPDISVVVRNLTGINEYPTFGLIEEDFPQRLKKILNIENEPIVDTNNPIYEAIKDFRDESKNTDLISSRDEDPDVFIKESFNQKGITVSSTLYNEPKYNEYNKYNDKPEIEIKKEDLAKINQSLKDFESEPTTFKTGEGFQYTSALLTFQSSSENAEWTAFLPKDVTEERDRKFGSGSLLQYPKLSDIERQGSFNYGNRTNNNDWFQRIIKANPDTRGFIGFNHKYLSSLMPSPEGLFEYLFVSSEFEGIRRLDPTPYVRFVDLQNNSYSSLKINSIKVKTLENDKYKLTSVDNRDKLFQDNEAKDEPINISIAPGQHLFIPIEFGFDTRPSKNLRRGYMNYSINKEGKEEGDRTNNLVNFIDLFDKKLYLSEIPPVKKDSLSSIRNDKTSLNIMVQSILQPITFSKDFIIKTKPLNKLIKKIHNRFAVGSLRNIISVRINGKDIQTDNPINDRRFSMSVYFAAGRCPYLMVYDSEKGYWIEFGTIIKGRQTKAQKDYEVHPLGNHPAKIRIEERDKEITYLDSISILYTDSQTGAEKEVKSDIPELVDVDDKYFVLKQYDVLDVNLKRLIPRTAVNVRLRVNGYYEPLAGVKPMYENHGV